MVNVANYAPTRKKLHTLIVGLGRMGANHLRALLENEAFEVVGIVDPVIRETRPTIPTYRHLTSEVPRPEVAIVASPAAFHHQAILYFRSRSVPMLIEKPIELAGGVFASCATDAFYAKFISVGHIERFNPAVLALRQMLPELGPIQSVTATRTGGEAPADGAARGGPAFDLAVHDLDICRWLFGRLRVDFADCTADEARIALTTQRGTPVEIVAGWGGGEKTRTLRVEGERGTVVIDYAARTLECTTGLPGGGETHRFPGDPLRAEHDAFAAYVNGGLKDRGILCGPEDAYAAVRLAEHAANGKGFE